MRTNRLEAFSDGVLAIIITIMVLELKMPHGSDMSALKPLAPVLVAYLLSFIYVGIYWNNHHHMIHVTERVNGGIMWANLHLLFWLSLVPFVTGWMGENHLSTAPTAAYGFVLLMAAVAYFILQSTITRQEGPNSRLSQALGRDWKGKMSIVLYTLALVSCIWTSFLAVGVYALVAVLWIIPDRRIEKLLVAD